MLLPVNFEWAVCEAGYEWAPDKKLKPPGLHRPPWNRPCEEMPAFRLRCDVQAEEGIYRPLDRETALFWNFAAMEPTPESVLSFANQYGPLGLGKRHEREVHRRGEPFYEWEYQITTMQFLVQIWKAVSTDPYDAVVIDKYFRPHGRKKYRVVPYKADILLNYKGEGEPSFLFVNLLTGSKSLDDPSFALYYVWTAVLLRVRNRLSLDCMRAAGGDIKLIAEPDSLVDALWLQFALAISDRKTYRQCPVCERSFEVSVEASRSDRKYCSNPCRNKALRRRQSEAKKLRAEGEHLRAIAKQLGSEVKTIKSWLGEE